MPRSNLSNKDDLKYIIGNLRRKYLQSDFTSTHDALDYIYHHYLCKVDDWQSFENILKKLGLESHVMSYIKHSIYEKLSNPNETWPTLRDTFPSPHHVISPAVSLVSRSYGSLYFQKRNFSSLYESCMDRTRQYVNLTGRVDSHSCILPRECNVYRPVPEAIRRLVNRSIDRVFRKDENAAVLSFPPGAPRAPAASVLRQCAGSLVVGGGGGPEGGCEDRQLELLTDLLCRHVEAATAALLAQVRRSPLTHRPASSAN